MHSFTQKVPPKPGTGTSCCEVNNRATKAAGRFFLFFKFWVVASPWSFLPELNFLRSKCVQCLVLWGSDWWEAAPTKEDGPFKRHLSHFRQAALSILWRPTLLFLFFGSPLRWRGEAGPLRPGWAAVEGCEQSLKVREKIICRPLPHASSRMEMLLMHVNSSGGFTQRTFGFFHPWHEGGGKHYWGSATRQRFLLSVRGLKGKSDLSEPLRERARNWLKWLLFSLCLLLKVIGVYQVFMDHL